MIERQWCVLNEKNLDERPSDIDKPNSGIERFLTSFIVNLLHESLCDDSQNFEQGHYTDIV